MPEDHQNERPMGGQWADQQKNGMKKQRRQATPTAKHEGSQHVDEDNQAQRGDDRTPDKPIGSQNQEACGVKSEKKGA